MSFVIGLMAALGGALALYQLVKQWPELSRSGTIAGLLFGMVVAVAGGTFVVQPKQKSNPSGGTSGAPFLSGGWSSRFFLDCSLHGARDWPVSLC